MEIEIGVARLERRDSVQGSVVRKSLERHLLAAFATRILPVDLVRCSTRVPDPRPEPDVLMAATALSLHLVVVTRNIADFQPMGVELLNPWDKQANATPSIRASRQSREQSAFDKRFQWGR